MSQRKERRKLQRALQQSNPDKIFQSLEKEIVREKSDYNWFNKIRNIFFKSPAEQKHIKAQELFKK
jgi:hypothetical protein